SRPGPSEPPRAVRRRFMVRRSIHWTLSLAVMGAVIAVTAIAAAAIAATPPNVAKALDSQRQLAAAHPEDASVQNDLGNLLLLAHRPAEAEAAYRRAVELDPNKISALFNLGLLTQGKGDRKGALARYEKVVKLDPRHAWAHYQMGAIHEAAGAESRAIDDYAKAFALDPQLAFPDVNPHLVDSHLVTQAMLRAYREGYVPPAAPKIYDDPARIASLLVPPVAGQPAKDDASANAQTTARQPQGPTVLREGNIPHGSTTGQAQPPGATTHRQSGTGLAGPTRNPAGARPGVRTWPRPDPSSNVDEDEEEMQQAPVQRGGGIAPPPSAIYYRPGVPS